MKTFSMIFRFIWKLKTVLFASALLLSLSVNVILFVGGSLYSIVNSGFEAATGIKTIAARNKAEIVDLSDNLVVERKAKRQLRAELSETSGQLVAEKAVSRELKGTVAEISGDLVVERKAKRELKSQVAEISSSLVIEQNAKRALKSELQEKTSQLAVERATQRALKSQVIDLTAGLVPFNGKKVALKAAVDETAEKIGKRSLKSATRNVSSMPGEAIPWLGTAVIVGVTALELYDLCETMKDMTELKRAFDPTLASSEEELEVCALKVPPKEEIIEVVKNSPKLAWNTAKDFTPTLAELKEIEIPKINLEEVWGDTTSGAKDLTEKLKKYWNK